MVPRDPIPGLPATLSALRSWGWLRCSHPPASPKHHTVVRQLRRVELSRQRVPAQRKPGHSDHFWIERSLNGEPVARCRHGRALHHTDSQDERYRALNDPRRKNPNSRLSIRVIPGSLPVHRLHGHRVSRLVLPGRFSGTRPRTRGRSTSPRGLREHSVAAGAASTAPETPALVGPQQRRNPFSGTPGACNARAGPR